MATKGITIEKPPFMTDIEWYYYKRQYAEFHWSKTNQTHNAYTFHNGWDAAIEDDHRRSVGEELPES